MVKIQCRHTRVFNQPRTVKFPECTVIGNRGNCIFRLACWMCKWGVDEELATEYFIDGWEDDTMDEKEIRSHVGNAYKTEEKNFGTLIFAIH